MKCSVRHSRQLSAFMSSQCSELSSRTLLILHTLFEIGEQEIISSLLCHVENGDGSIHIFIVHAGLNDSAREMKQNIFIPQKSFNRP